VRRAVIRKDIAKPIRLITPSDYWRDFCSNRLRDEATGRKALGQDLRTGRRSIFGRSVTTAAAGFAGVPTSVSHSAATNWAAS